MGEYLISLFSHLLPPGGGSSRLRDGANCRKGGGRPLTARGRAEPGRGAWLCHLPRDCGGTSWVSRRAARRAGQPAVWVKPRGDVAGRGSQGLDQSWVAPGRSPPPALFPPCCVQWYRPAADCNAARPEREGLLFGGRLGRFFSLPPVAIVTASRAGPRPRDTSPPSAQRQPGGCAGRCQVPALRGGARGREGAARGSRRGHLQGGGRCGASRRWGAS